MTRTAPRFATVVLNDGAVQVIIKDAIITFAASCPAEREEISRNKIRQILTSATWLDIVCLDSSVGNDRKPDWLEKVGHKSIEEFVEVLRRTVSPSCP